MKRPRAQFSQDIAQDAAVGVATFKFMRHNVFLLLQDKFALILLSLKNESRWKIFRIFLHDASMNCGGQYMYQSVDNETNNWNPFLNNILPSPPINTGFLVNIGQQCIRVITTYFFFLRPSVGNAETPHAANMSLLCA